ncbi:MAG: 2-oxoacid:acceptor oxidoreductase family protein [Thermodesulfobacteriota bacterium]
MTPWKDIADDRYEIRLSGSGGQGIILASVVLAEAVAVHEALQVSQTQSYGPEARGGRCKAEVVISDKEIDYPKVLQLDMLLAMNQEACDSYFYDFKPNGLLLVDSTFVEQVPTSRSIAIPFTRIARDDIGKVMTANMVALGAIAAVCPLITTKNMEKAVMSRAPKGTADINRKAFKAGVKALKKVDISRLPRSITPEDEDEL